MQQYCKKQIATVLLFVGIFPFIGGCGSLTGIPGHGGGKRFAVEQELVAAATRAAIKQIDLEALRGRKVNLFINAIDDIGSGNLVGGRFSVVSQVRGDYIHTPTVTEKSIYPRYESVTQSRSTSRQRSESENASVTSDGSSTASESLNETSSSSDTHSVTSTLLASPEEKKTQQRGSGGEVQVGVEYDGLGSYRNSEEISSHDIQYLSGLLQTYLFLQGVHLVPPSEAEVDVYVIVDVFGTVRTRVEWFVANNEILRAKTVLEMLAVDHFSGEVVMPPQSASVEAEYNEQYLLWAGPVMIKKYLKNSSPLLADYTDLDEELEENGSIELDETVAYPFRYQLEEWRKAKD